METAPDYESVALDGHKRATARWEERVKSVALLGFLFIICSGHPKKAPSGEPIRSQTAPQITRFVSTPETIHVGEKAVLVWNTRNVQTVLLEEAADAHDDVPNEFLHSIGHFPPGGTLEVQPRWTTTYVISCGDSDIGTASASTTVRVQ